MITLNNQFLRNLGLGQAEAVMCLAHSSSISFPGRSDLPQGCLAIEKDRHFDNNPSAANVTKPQRVQTLVLGILTWK